MSNRRIFNLISIAVVAATLLGVWPGGASADTFTYASQRRQVRAGIIATRALELPGGYGSEIPDPHIFYVLDSRSDLKPYGLEFVNPLAPTIITADIYTRWQKRQRGGFPDPAFGSGPESRQFRVGSRVGKNMGCYWEVNVDNLSADDLRQYDLLYLHSHRNDTAVPADVQAKLRRFVEGGGTLWVENCGRFTFAPAPSGGSGQSASFFY